MVSLRTPRRVEPNYGWLVLRETFQADVFELRQDLRLARNHIEVLGPLSIVPLRFRSQDQEHYIEQLKSQIRALGQVPQYGRLEEF